VEGLDGAGTTTQTRLLAQALARSAPVYLTHEPSDGPIGLQIRLALEHRIQVDAATLAALFAADRMDHLFYREGIARHLERGTAVITDRYYLSSFAYQGLSLDWAWIWTLHAQCLQPDVTIFIDVPVEVCLARIAAGRGARVDLFETRETLVRARESYVRAIERLREEGEVIAIVDGDAPLEEVQGQVWERVRAVL
jgi:dTMP kinase